MDDGFVERLDCQSSSPYAYDDPERPRMLKVVNGEVMFPAPPDNNQTPAKKRKRSGKKRNKRQKKVLPANPQSTNDSDQITAADIIVETNEENTTRGVAEDKCASRKSENVPPDMEVRSMAESILKLERLVMELQGNEELKAELTRTWEEAKVNRRLCREQQRKMDDLEQRSDCMCRAVSRHEGLLQPLRDDVRQLAALIANVATKADIERLRMLMVRKDRADRDLHRTLLRNVDNLFDEIDELKQQIRAIANYVAHYMPGVAHGDDPDVLPAPVQAVDAD